MRNRMVGRFGTRCYKRCESRPLATLGARHAAKRIRNIDIFTAEIHVVAIAYSGLFWSASRVKPFRLFTLAVVISAATIAGPRAGHPWMLLASARRNTPAGKLSA
jgi:hypothetical protein